LAEDSWPARDLSTFRLWFDARFHEIVFDLAADQPLVEEDW